MKKEQINLSSLLCRGDHARRDGPHALRDALANCDIIVIKESAGTSFFVY